MKIKLKKGSLIMKCLTKTFAVSLFVAVAFTVSADNLLKNNTFSKESGWTCWMSKQVTDAGGPVIKLEDGKAVVNSPAIAGGYIQLYKSINVDADKSYTVKFKANAEKAGQITVNYILHKDPYTGYASVNIALEPGEKEYECTLAVKNAKDGTYDAPRSLRLLLATLKGVTVTISDISFEEVK
jgi:hypothetical protein